MRRLCLTLAWPRLSLLPALLAGLRLNALRWRGRWCRGRRRLAALLLRALPPP